MAVILFFIKSLEMLLVISRTNHIRNVHDYARNHWVLKYGLIFQGVVKINFKNEHAMVEKYCCSKYYGNLNTKKIMDKSSRKSLYLCI